MRIIFLSCFLLFSYYSIAQQVSVPSKMEFAGIKLRIMDDARAEIQKDVDALTASTKYYEIKAERARTYFPIIERIFREENLPDDFKYLSLQESALISDAVSSSNAVGYWQFKDFTAVEVGMRVDKTVDERKNIVASTRGAARYLHNNNQFFDNWLHTLQSYQMGAGGAMKVLSKGHKGSNSMVVNKKTYWYVKKFLAHKIAYEGATDKPGQIKISEYYDGAGKTIKEIAKEYELNEDEVLTYNKWLQKGRIPDDKKYAVILPKEGLGTGTQISPTSSNIVASKKAVPAKTIEYKFDEPGEFPKIEDPVEARAGKIVEINGLPGIVAGKKDRIPELAKKADISLRKFLKYNDLGIDGRLVPGQVYYMKSKRGKAKAYYHIVEKGETLWTISQKFGLKLKKLKAKNRIRENVALKPGRVLWLRYVRPSKVIIEYKEIEVEKELPDVLTTLTPNSADNDLEIIDSQDSVIISEMDTLQTKALEQESYEIATELEEAPVQPVVENEPLIEEEPIESEVINPVESEPEQIQKIHDVKIGETYYSISKIYEISVLDLLQWNGLKIADKLSIGQKLIVIMDIPDEAEEKQSINSNQKVIHVVKQGETLYSIARNYNVSVQDILEWNSKEDSSIKFDEKLIILLDKKEND